ncbi:translation initiation factor [Mesohalobacter halotolerans]|uniref:Translation initiation factor n=1 Tax=Mesohalobacter halotolerans TaxID=1883405 RepID=A0A4U5TQK0_9FLAO|nr:translation initiation factor [Mesohalobacter halotolerans]TKS56323.1 translation initiation factor [Mesohalobacter halotolerans]
MDLKDQLQNLFPDHKPEEEQDKEPEPEIDIWLQDAPLICKYEKRQGKPNTIIENYNGAKSDFKKLTQYFKRTLGVGGSHKNEKIIIQGDYRDEIMDILKNLGFTVKRVGG